MFFYFFFPRTVILYQTKTLLSLKFLHWLFQEKGTSGPKIDLWTRINLVQDDVSLHGPENIPFVKLYWFTFICRPNPVPFVMKCPSWSDSCLSPRTHPLPLFFVFQFCQTTCLKYVMPAGCSPYLNVFSFSTTFCCVFSPFVFQIPP